MAYNIESEKDENEQGEGDDSNDVSVQLDDSDLDGLKDLEMNMNVSLQGMDKIVLNAIIGAEEESRHMETQPQPNDDY